MAALTMETPDGVPVQSATVGVRAPTQSRLLYVENLRILLIGLVILTHLAITYGAPAGDWYYKENGQLGLVPAILMLLFLALNQSFFMGLFFMISAYFIPTSCDRKGTGVFIVDRLRRLGIPLLFYFCVINPFLVYVLQGYYGLDRSLWEFLREGYVRSLAVGPLWFVEALLIFSILYSFCRRLTTSTGAPPRTDDRAPGNGAIALFVLGLGLVTFVARIWMPVGFWFEPLHLQLAHFSQYVAFFLVGLVAYRRGWLPGLSDAQVRIWQWVALALVPLFPVLVLAGGALHDGIAPFLGGLNWQSLAFALWEQGVGMAIVITLLAWFRRKLNRQGVIARAMSGASYATYVLHPVVLVLIGLALSGVHLDLALKFLLVAPVAISLSFLAGHLLRKLPLAREVL